MAARLYSLFEKGKDGKWFRVSPMSFPKSKAIHVFQNRLLEPFMGGTCGIRELRPVRSFIVGANSGENTPKNIS